MIDWFGPVITELYGSSEDTGPVVCSSNEWLERSGTVGRSDFLELSIVDDDGNDLPVGGIGTVYVKRPDGAPQYHGDPEKSAAMPMADVAVFDIPHPEWGEEIKAVVEPEPGVDVDVAEVLAFAAEHLAKFKIPRSVDIVDALSREASGKLEKRLLRDPYWE